MQTESRPQSLRRYAVLSAGVGVFFSLIVGIVVFGQGAFSFAYAHSAPVRDVLLLPASLALLWLAALLRRALAGRARAARPPRAGRIGLRRLWLPGYFALLLALQLLVTRSVWFYAGWDIGNVYGAAGLLAQGVGVGSEYFRLCPNNAPLTLLLVAPLWLASRLGLAVPYAILPYLGALLCNLSCLLAVLCVRRLTPSRFARAGAVALCTVWIAFSTTMTVPYTDVFAMLFPVLAFFLYLTKLKPFPKWLLISLACFLGASVKPTVLIVEIALIAVSALRAFPLRRMDAARWRRVGAVLAAIVLGAIPGRVWQDQATAFLAGSAVPEEQLSETHYLMLGMNGQTYGGHSPEDVTFSTSFKTLHERRQANLQRAWERVSGRSFGQNLRFFSVKAYKAFNDGLLASDNSYLILEKPARSDALSVFLRRVYAINGDLHGVAATFEQVVWQCLLLLCLLALFGRTRRRPGTAALALTLFGVAVYLLLFEVWPRYLYLYAPLFAILASLGLSRLRLPARASAADSAKA